jgi:small multidrug resistance pump
MITLTPSIIALVATSVVCQVIGASLMPMTKGLTEIIPTLGFAIAFAIGLGIMARLINSGINLSALLPFMAAVVPLCAIAVGVFVYGESASTLKISLLIFSCLTIGFASSMS